MTDHSTDSHPWAERFKGAFWLALILFALAGWMVVGKLPSWIAGLVAAAGVALGTLLFLPHWLVRRHDPSYSAGQSFGAFAFAGALGMVGLASLPIFYLAFSVQSGPAARRRRSSRACSTLARRTFTSRWSSTWNRRWPMATRCSTRA